MYKICIFIGVMIALDRNEIPRLRSLSFGAFRPTIHPCGKPQDILAKANRNSQPVKFG